MDNISCQQLTNELRHIQQLTSACDYASNSKVNKIKLFNELKDLIDEMFNLASIKLANGQRICLHDYDIIKKYLTKNGYGETLKIVGIILKTNKDFRIYSLNLPLQRTSHFEKQEIEVEELSELKDLRDLYFDSSESFPEDQSFLGLFKTVKNLILDNTNFSDLKSIMDLPNLEVLSLEKCKHITDFSHLLSIANLKKVYLSETRLDKMIYNLNDEAKNILKKLESKGVKIIIDPFMRKCF